MNGKSGLVIAVACALLLSFAASADAGWVMTQRSGGFILLSAGKMKSTFKKGGGVIIDGTKGDMILVDEQRKVFALGTLDEYCQTTSKIFDHLAQGMSPEHRKMMEDIMGSTPKVTVAEAGVGETIAGFKTTKYEVNVDDQPYEELWLTADSSVMKDAQPLIGTLKKFRACAGLGIKSAPEAAPEYQKLMEKGLVLKSVSHGGDQPVTDTDVVEVEKKEIPGSEFQGPQDYRKITFTELMSLKMKAE